jgi:phosphoglycerate kinase
MIIGINRMGPRFNIFNLNADGVGGGGGSIRQKSAEYLEGVPLLGDNFHPLNGLRGKRVLLVADYNLPIDKKTGEINIFRLERSAPTVRAILDNGGKLVIASHFGRPNGQVSSKYSLDPVVKAFKNYFNVEIVDHGITLNDGQPLTKSDLGNVVNRVSGLGEGQVIILPNIRFWPGEESKNAGEQTELGVALANICDVYINDAFGAAHRAHASKAFVHPHVMRTNYALGFLIQEEISRLETVRDNPELPVVTFLGGSKSVDKYKVSGSDYEIKEGKIKALLKLMEKGKVMVGGKNLYAFLAAMGKGFGDGFNGTVAK